MKLKEKYTTLDRALQAIQLQAIEGASYCREHFAGIDTPGELFQALKLVTTYRLDPKDIELIQTPRTLFEDNYHGIPGAGDCDCFTTLTLSCCIALNIKPVKVVLAGNDIEAPVHIYSLVKGQIFDLTAPFIGYAKKYRHYQYLEFPI